MTMHIVWLLVAVWCGFCAGFLTAALCAAAKDSCGECPHAQCPTGPCAGPLANRTEPSTDRVERHWTQDRRMTR